MCTSWWSSPRITSRRSPPPAPTSSRSTRKRAPHLHRQLSRIRELGAKAGVALNPSTPVEHAARRHAPHLDLLLVMTVNPGFGGQSFIAGSLEKIRRARAMLDAAGSSAVLEVDGGIARDTIAQCWRAGADTFVAGKAIFGAADPRRRSALCAPSAHRSDAAPQRRADAWRYRVRHARRLGVGRRPRRDPACALVRPRLTSARSPSTTPIVERSLADYAGHVVIVNIWATWCAPCIVEMPSLEALHRTTPATVCASSR